MAAEVAAQFTATQLEDYGNIILNGYQTVGPNTTGKLGWAWADSPLAPAVPLPSVSSTRPILRGWTTNYLEYYTQIPPNGYGVNPGDPTMFEYTVHSFTPAFGTITTVGDAQEGYGYPGGIFTNVPTTGGQGTGATLDVTVDPISGGITVDALNNPGSGYAVGDGLTVFPGLGSGFAVFVTAISVTSVANQPKWSQAPRRFYQNQTASFTPPNANQQAIQYSYIYPVADNPVAPPIDVLL